MTEATLARPASDAAAPVARERSLRRLVFNRFLRHKPAVIGFVTIAAITLACVLIPPLLQYDPRTNVEQMRNPPSAEHVFGTDELGRDLLMRIWVGGQVSLRIGFATMLLAIGIGTVVGSLSGYYGRWLDTVLMRFTDFMLSIPTLFLLLIFAQLLRSTNLPEISGSEVPIIIIIGILSWMGIARVVRGQFLSLKKKEFVEAAQMSGARSRRIIFRHILPNAASPIIVAATLRIGAAIITESTLSFLGFGVQPPAATWGNMLRNAQGQMTYAPWTAIFPGLFILITVLSINYVGDGLRDALDPRHTD